MRLINYAKLTKLKVVHIALLGNERRNSFIPLFSSTSMKRTRFRQWNGRNRGEKKTKKKTTEYKLDSQWPIVEITHVGQDYHNAVGPCVTEGTGWLTFQFNESGNQIFSKFLGLQFVKFGFLEQEFFTDWLDYCQTYSRKLLSIIFYPKEAVTGQRAPIHSCLVWWILLVLDQPRWRLKLTRNSMEHTATVVMVQPLVVVMTWISAMQPMKLSATAF